MYSQRCIDDKSLTLLCFDCSFPPPPLLPHPLFPLLLSFSLLHPVSFLTTSSSYRFLYLDLGHFYLARYECLSLIFSFPFGAYFLVSVFLFVLFSCLMLLQIVTRELSRFHLNCWLAADSTYPLPRKSLSSHVPFSHIYVSLNNTLSIYFRRVTPMYMYLSASPWN